jgi:hypothetical protein
VINHLILLTEAQDLHVADGKLLSGHRKIAIESLGSVQCLSAASRWSQTALELLATQCPVVMARWDKQQKKWLTFSLTPKARYVNPTALWKLCRLPPQRATQMASALLWTKVCNQHQMLHAFDPRMADKPQLKENSFNRILRLESSYARFFWPRWRLTFLNASIVSPPIRSMPRSITATDFSTMPSNGNALLPASIPRSASFTNCGAAVPVWLAI